jgi:hypothetical protein
MTARSGGACLAVRCAATEHALWQEVTSGLNEALGGACTFQSVWRDDLCPTADDGCDVLCLSMLPDLCRPRSEWPAIEAQWRLAAAALRDRELERGAMVFIVTLFRYTTPEDVALRPLLRRLNLLAARLSQEFGLFVIDIDRTFAHAGGLELGADARLVSVEARRSAADLIVDSLLSIGIDHVAEPAAIQTARSWYGSRRVGASAYAPTVASSGQIKLSYVKGRAQTSMTQSHDVYGGIHSILRDLGAPRLGLRWRFPLLVALWRLAWERALRRIVRQRM